MVVVTGATGHVGNVLVRELRGRSERVRALVPPREAAGSLADVDVEVVPADVRDAAALSAAFAGADVVYHLAGIISISPGRARLMSEVNVGGTRNVVAACLAAGVRRLVYTSSVHALVEPPAGTAMCETREFRPELLVGDYARSKALASRAVLEGVRRGLDAVLVFPSGIVGPYDFLGSEMGELFVDFAHGRMPAYIDGAYDFVDVRDVVAGILLAAEKGRRGEGYILSGERISVRELLALLEGLTGRKPPRLRLPFWLARVAAVFAPAYYRLARSKPRFTSYSLHVLNSNCLMSSEKAWRELGYRPRPVREAVAGAVEWLRRAGRIPAPAAVRGS